MFVFSLPLVLTPSSFLIYSDHFSGRFYTKEKQLPEDLKPHAMERNHGLRARCIRALFLLAPPLVERVQPKGRAPVYPARTF